MTVPGLGAVGSGGRGVPGSVEKRKRNQLGYAGERDPDPGSTYNQPGMACSEWVDE